MAESALRGHLAELAEALEQECAWQQREHERLLRLPWPQRVEAGISWPRMRSVDLELGRRVLLHLRSDRGGLHAGISPGEPVVVGTPGRPDTGWAGLCVDVEDDHAWVELQRDDTLPDAELLTVTRRFDSSDFVRKRHALFRANAHDSPLKRALLEGQLPDPVAPVALPQLSPGQRDAAGLILSDAPLVLVHGPPGTGKTWLLARALEQLVAAGDRPWALADSNAATDALALATAGRGLDVVRLGHPARIGAAARHLSVTERLDNGPLRPALKALDRDLKRLASQGHWRERRGLLAERRALRQRARAELLERAQVLACTLGSLARLAADLPPATTAVVDEATQATEPALWIPVPYVQRLVLVGDPHQLGPVVTQPNNLLERSIFDRLLGQSSALPMLDLQHRMNDGIVALVQSVYGAAYRTAPEAAQRTLATLTSVRATPLTQSQAIWIDTAGAGFDDERDPVTLSVHNPGEARLVVQVVQALLDAGVDASDIGVITPYSAQASRIARQLEAVEVASVNAFQGREKEAIVCTWVRSNAEAELGFVADRRRLTVALTRARRLLVCVGDSATLASNPAFAETLAGLEVAGAMRSVWEAPWSSSMAP